VAVTAALLVVPTFSRATRATAAHRETRATAIAAARRPAPAMVLHATKAATVRHQRCNSSTPVTRARTRSPTEVTLSSMTTEVAGVAEAAVATRTVTIETRRGHASTMRPLPLTVTTAIVATHLGEAPDRHRSRIRAAARHGKVEQVGTRSRIAPLLGTQGWAAASRSFQGTTLSKDGATIHHQNATEPHTRRRKIGDQPFQTDDPVRTRDNRIVVAAVETRAGIVGMRTGRSSTALAPLRPVTIVVTRAIKILPLHTVDRPEDTRAVMRREMRLEIHHESVAVDQVDIHKRIILVGWATRDHTRTDQRAIHGGTEEDTSGRRTIIAPKSTHGTLNICSIGRAASRCLCFIAYVN
jgi:hypothetical protein